MAERYMDIQTRVKPESLYKLGNPEKENQWASKPLSSHRGPVMLHFSPFFALVILLGMADANQAPLLSNSVWEVKLSDKWDVRVPLHAN
jgi:hypothetical protein